MSEPARKRPRITEDLHTLGRIIHAPNTPKQRTPSGKENTVSGNRVFVRTPGSIAAAQTPSARTPTASARSRRAGSARRGAPTTPHAIRALQQRRNAVQASGGGRRRSARVQRETPRDDLRALSRVLAKKTRQPTPEPEAPTPRTRRISGDVDDSPVIGQAPRLSLAFKDLEDDSFHEAPPGRPSYSLDNEDSELDTRRRALLGRDRLSYASMLDPTLVDLDDLGPEEIEDVTERRRQLLEQDMTMDIEDMDADGETGELRALMDARRQSGLTSDMSEITDGDPTFLFRIPERSRLSLAPPQEEDGPDDNEDDEYEDIDEPQAEVADPRMDEVESDNGEDTEDPIPLREDSLPLMDEAQGADVAATTTRMPHTRHPKEIKVSAFGLEYPSFPPAVVKRVTSTFARSYGGSGKLNKETLAAMQQASDWFFEQVSEDLASYADHARRKTIDESDMITLMKRQRLLNNNTTLFSLAQKFLPRELLQEVRMVPQVKAKKRKRPAARMDTIDEDGE